MQKHNRRGRASLRELDLRRLYTCAINDISGTLPDESVGALHRTLAASPGEFRNVVDDMLHKAESGLASGGASQYIALRQLQALLKKCPEWYAIGKDERRLNAYNKFLLSEQSCRRANKRLSYARSHWSRTKRYAWYAEVVNTASLVVQTLFGPLDHDTELSMLEECRFGSGSTFLHTGENSSLYWKLEGNHSVTEGAIPMLHKWMALSPRIYDAVKESPLNVVNGNRLSFVPKDWDIDRTIAIEPSWNVLLQLGVNGYLARRFKRYGIEIDNQAKGWRFAREGSICSSHATIDLSSASDTVSTELVKWLLPKGWYDLLNNLRSDQYQLDGTWHSYAKFSSMGNGFTFPLETAIFFSLAKATASCLGLDSNDVVVYGDDIIVPQQLYAPLVEVLRFCGFGTNSKKSFNHGYFRETCGRDFLQGKNVRPVYLRKRPGTVDEVYSLYNRLYTWSIVPLPSVLSYLHSVVNNAHYGPGMLGRSDTVEQYRWNRQGRRFESYFFDDPATKKYSESLQTFVYSTLILDRKEKKDNRAVDEHLRYLCFLAGIEGGRITLPSRTKWFERRYQTTYWPSMAEVRRWGMESLDS